MARDERKIEELRALLDSYAWGLVEAALEARCHRHFQALVSCPLEEVALERAAIKAIREMEKMPEMLLKEEEGRNAT